MTRHPRAAAAYHRAGRVRARDGGHPAGRLVGLDGIRDLAALFVLLNHIFERAWRGYPADRAPLWAAWMTYGRFAVVMFIALPSFSNRAFWSIAIEAQIYVLLPLLLLVPAGECPRDGGPGAGRDPAARDRVLRPSVRRRVRALLPAAPRVDCAATGDVGPAVAAAANRVGGRRRALARR
jgi:peptidoglycan/LPS O-acetylase OafA/YrhL